LQKTCPSAALSTTNPTLLDPGSNSRCSGGKPATNRLSYGKRKSLVSQFTFLNPTFHFKATHRLYCHIPFRISSVHMTSV
jgi:hypothetical protein